MNKKRLTNFVDSEIEHFQAGFRPVKLETKLEPYVVDIGSGVKVKLGGIADRIDEKSYRYIAHNHSNGSAGCEHFNCR